MSSNGSYGGDPPRGRPRPPPQIARKGAPPQQIARQGAPPQQIAGQGAPPQQIARQGAPPQQIARQGAPPQQIAQQGAPPQLNGQQGPLALQRNVQQLNPLPQVPGEQANLAMGWLSDVPEPRRHLTESVIWPKLDDEGADG